MTKFAIRYAIAFLLLVPAQGVIFNHLTIAGVAVPLVFVWLVLSLPITIGTNLSIILGFLCGLGVDIFCDTPGVNALCCTTLAFARKPLFHLYASFDDDLGGKAPSTASMGHEAYVKYILTASLIYCVMMFTVESFRFFNLWIWLLRIVTSTIYTTIMLYCLDAISPRRRD